MRRLVLLFVVACGGSDAAPPPGEITLVVTSPTAGEEILGTERPMITVAGTVATTNPDYGALEAWVNGVRVDVAADGSFTTDLVPQPGITHLKIEGGDGLGPLVGQQFDVLWAPDYLPPIASSTGFDVTSALDLELGQRFFDARQFGTTLDLTTDPVVAHDLGSALELILHHIQLATLLPNRLQFGGGSAALDVAITSATPAEILVDAKIIDATVKGVDLAIDLNGVFLAMNGTFVFGNRTLIVDGGIAADMHATARLTLGVAADGSIEVTVTDVTAVVGPLVPSFVGPDGDELDAFINIGNSDFRTVIEGLIQQQLIPTFTDKVPPLLETLLGAADSLLDNVAFELDTGLGAPVMATIDSNIGALDVVAGPPTGLTPGHVTVRENVTIRTSGSPVHPTTRGAPRLDADPLEPTLVTSALGLTIRQEFLNTLLHSLWNSGLLEGNATFGGLSAQISAKLPPVVKPTPIESACEIDGLRCDITLQLGQLEVALPDFEQSFGVNAVAGARIKVDGSTVSLVIQMTPELTVWETSAVPGTLSSDAVRDVISNLVWPMLFETIGDKLTISLPLPDLAELGLDQLAPGLANAQLVVQMKQQPDVSPGFLSLGADIELSTPPPP